MESIKSRSKIIDVSQVLYYSMRKKIKTSKSGKKICLLLVNPIYKKAAYLSKTPDGKFIRMEKDKLHKETQVLKWIDRDAIISVEEYVTKKGTIAKSRSIIFDKYSNRFYATWHSVNDIIDALEERKEGFVGFKPYFNSDNRA